MLDTRITGTAIKPNRVKDAKDRNYHIKAGRWGIAMANNAKQSEHLHNIMINEQFVAANKQWESPEDYIHFLMDNTGQTTNRIKVEINYLQIMHNQFVGNVSRMGTEVGAIAFSPNVQSRKLDNLTEMFMWQDAAMRSGDEALKNMIFANKPIGTSDMETAAKHDSYYSDSFLQAMNGLIKYSKAINNIELLKREIAEDMSLSGMAVLKPCVSSRDYIYERKLPKQFFFDRKAIKYDLSDADFMGDWYDCMGSDIYERSNELSSADIALLENYMTYGYNRGEGRLRVYNVCWRDVMVCDWGFVRDEVGDIVFERINYVNEFEEEARYTVKDLVDIKELTVYQKKQLNNRSGLAMTTRYTDQWRFVEFIPSEYVSSQKREGEYADIVLNYGVLPYQQQNTYSPFNMETPYKVGFYMYIDGFVYSPLDIAINPQRVANRLMSVTENMLNNARGSGTVIAHESIAKLTDVDEGTINLKMKRNEPIVIQAAAMGGVQNAIGTYGGGIGNDTLGMLNMATSFLGVIEKITGVNEAMKGQASSSDQLVGTMQLMIQRGTVVQERYYSALKEIIKQCFQATLSSGKRFYINEKPKLSFIIGDLGVRSLELTKDMALEECGCKVDFIQDEKQERQNVDLMLFQLLQAGLIDKIRFSNLIGRGSLDDVWMAVREFAKESSEAEKQMAAIKQQEMQMQQQMQGNEMKQFYDEKQKDRETKLLDTALKTGAKQQQVQQ